MLLFQGCFGNILHTGDCRFTPEVVRAVQEALRGDCECEYEREYGNGATPGWGCGCSCGGAERLDLLYLDCTFADLPLDFPSREEAVRHAEQLIRGWPGGAGSSCGGGGGGAAAAGQMSGLRRSSSLRRVFLSSDLLGTEPLLAMAGRVFGQPLYVPPPERHKEYGFGNADLVRQRRQELEILLPGLPLSTDPSCVFHLCGVRDFAHRGRKTQHQCQQHQQHQHRRLAASAAAQPDDGEASGGGPLRGTAGRLPPAVAVAVAAGESAAAGHCGGDDAAGGCLYIRASTQAFGQRIRDQYASNPGQLLAVRAAAPAPTAAVQERAVHYVLYSLHSSRGELAAALTALRPRATRPISADQAGCMAAVVSERAGSERAQDVEAEIAAQMAWAAAAAPPSPGYAGPRSTWEVAEPPPLPPAAATGPGNLGTTDADDGNKEWGSTGSGLHESGDEDEEEGQLGGSGGGGSHAAAHGGGRQPESAATATGQGSWQTGGGSGGAAAAALRPAASHGGTAPEPQWPSCSTAASGAAAAIAAAAAPPLIPLCGGVLPSRRMPYTATLAGVFGNPVPPPVPAVPVATRYGWEGTLVHARRPTCCARWRPHTSVLSGLMDLGAQAGGVAAAAVACTSNGAGVPTALKAPAWSAPTLQHPGARHGAESAAPAIADAGVGEGYTGAATATETATGDPAARGLATGWADAAGVEVMESVRSGGCTPQTSPAEGRRREPLRPAQAPPQRPVGHSSVAQAPDAKCGFTAVGRSPLPRELLLGSSPTSSSGGTSTGPNLSPSYSPGPSGRKRRRRTASGVDTGPQETPAPVQGGALGVVAAGCAVGVSTGGRDLAGWGRAMVQREVEVAGGGSSALGHGMAAAARPAAAAGSAGGRRLGSEWVRGDGAGEGRVATAGGSEGGFVPPPLPQQQLGGGRGHGGCGGPLVKSPGAASQEVGDRRTRRPMGFLAALLASSDDDE
ncbi:hypothetical protein PLESTF_000188800 [Pleodorina starrii]|nr:hypothetical protein PLESTF_000188800 [Pleodorina starrii]